MLGPTAIKTNTKYIHYKHKIKIIQKYNIIWTCPLRSVRFHKLKKRQKLIFGNILGRKSCMLPIVSMLITSGVSQWLNMEKRPYFT